MDEMNNMNEVTTEETSVEVTPVVAENNEVHEEAKNSGINTWAAVGAAVVGLTAGAIVAGVAKQKAKKAEAKVEKEKKPKKHFKLRPPIVIEKDDPEVKDVDYKDIVEDTTEED